MEKEKKFLSVNLSLGHWLYNFALLQFLPMVYVLKGAVIFGLFPSIASIYYIFYKWIVLKHYDLSIREEFNRFYKDNFWESNKIGWLLTSGFLFLLFDLYVSQQFIQSIFLHTMLVIISFLYLVICFYVFPVFSRYDFSKSRNYVKQAFFMSLSSIAQSIAVLIVIVLLSYLFSYVPFLLLFFGIPIFFGAIAWFVFQGILKAENMRREVENPN